MAAVPHYGVNDGELLVFEDAPAWRGRIDGHRATKAAALPETPDAIVLLESPEIDDSRTPFLNLLRVGPCGEVKWRAELPEPDDWTDEYVDFDLYPDGALGANTWSCFSVALDPETGRILSKVFTK
jgi:hypothetical protein